MHRLWKQLKLKQDVKYKCFNSDLNVKFVNNTSRNADYSVFSEHRFLHFLVQLKHICSFVNQL